MSGLLPLGKCPGTCQDIYHCGEMEQVGPVDTANVSADLISLVDKPKATKKTGTNGFF